MQKQYLKETEPIDVILPDNHFTRKMHAVLKDGKITLINQKYCSVFFRNSHEIFKLRDMDIKKDKNGYYIKII